ncbi:MAG: peptidylprolyl isomerase [Phycisphaerales bacterium JB052]
MLRTLITMPILFTAYLMLAGCATQPVGETTVSQPSRPDPVAIIDGQAVTITPLVHAMSELVGDEALTEHVLDLALTQRCEREGIGIDADLIERERVLLTETLTGIDEQANSPRVIESLRVRRGLGPDRFERLLRRNAMLRALVGLTATPDTAAIERAMQQAFGQRYRVRLFVSEQPEPASGLRARLAQSDPEARRWVFADACVDQSLHPSAERGGLIPELTATNPGYPQSVLDAMRALVPGEYSRVISTEAGYALVYLERIIPAVTPSESQRLELIEQISRNEQRIAMQRLAQQLLEEHEVIVLDKSLNWAWSNRP